MQPAGEGPVGRTNHGGQRRLPGDGDGGAGRGQDRYDRNIRSDGFDERSRPRAGRDHGARGPEHAVEGIQEIAAVRPSGQRAGRSTHQVRQVFQRGVQGGQPRPGVDEAFLGQVPGAQGTVVVQRAVAGDIRRVGFLAAQPVLGRGLGDSSERGLVQTRGHRVQHDERPHAVAVHRRGTGTRTGTYLLPPGRPPRGCRDRKLGTQPPVPSPGGLVGDLTEGPEHRTGRLRCRHTARVPGQHDAQGRLRRGQRERDRTANRPGTDHQHVDILHCHDHSRSHRPTPCPLTSDHVPSPYVPLRRNAAHQPRHEAAKRPLRPRPGVVRSVRPVPNVRRSPGRPRVPGHL